MNHPVDVRGLRKSFQGREVLHGIDLAIPSGSVFALLGRNGAGKSTTLRLLLGLLKADGGELRVLGRAMPRERETVLAEVGSMIESPSLYENLTAHENLLIDARLRGLDAAAIREALAIVELPDSRKLVKHYSLGMKQRLSLALAVLGKPKLLLLDEPTNGLDPMGIADMRRLLRELPVRLNTTVLLSTHLLAEVEQVATDVAILEQGELKYSGPLENLRNGQRRMLRMRAGDMDHLAIYLRSRHLEFGEDAGRRTLDVPVRDENEAHMLLRQAIADGVNIFHAALEERRLEEIYFEIIGHAQGELMTEEAA